MSSYHILTATRETHLNDISPSDLSHSLSVHILASPTKHDVSDLLVVEARRHVEPAHVATHELAHARHVLVLHFASAEARIARQFVALLVLLLAHAVRNGGKANVE